MEESKGETKKLEHVVKLKEKKIEALESRYVYFAQRSLVEGTSNNCLSPMAVLFKHVAKGSYHLTGLISLMLRSNGSPR